MVDVPLFCFDFQSCFFLHLFSSGDFGVSKLGHGSLGSAHPGQVEPVAKGSPPLKVLDSEVTGYRSRTGVAHSRHSKALQPQVPLHKLALTM